MQKYHAFFCAGTKRTNMNQQEPEKFVGKCVSLRVGKQEKYLSSSKITMLLKIENYGNIKWKKQEL